MNILGIDYGKKRIGLSWVDTDLGVVLPIGQIESGNWKTDLVKIAKEDSADMFVVGLPLGLDGKENQNTQRVRDFVRELQDLVSLSVEFVDERFSSRSADAIGGSVSRDEKSAMVILQSYLDSR